MSRKFLSNSLTNIFQIGGGSSTNAKGIQQVKTASRHFREEIEKSAEAQGLDTKELQKEVNDIKKELNEITGTVKRKR